MQDQEESGGRGTTLGTIIQTPGVGKPCAASTIRNWPRNWLAGSQTPVVLTLSSFYCTLFGNGTGTEREQNGNEQGAPAPATPNRNERGNGTERDRNGTGNERGQGYRPNRPSDPLTL